jgi:hypothetical protein
LEDLIDFNDLPLPEGQPLATRPRTREEEVMLGMVVRLYRLGATPMNNEATRLLDELRQQGRI